MGWLSLVDLENKRVMSEIHIENNAFINQIAYYGNKSSEFFLACSNGLYLAKLVEKEGQMQQLEVITEKHKEGLHITFVDLITENTFLLGIFGEENGTNKL